MDPGEVLVGNVNRGHGLVPNPLGDRGDLWLENGGGEVRATPAARGVGVDGDTALCEFQGLDEIALRLNDAGKLVEDAGCDPVVDVGVDEPLEAAL